MRTGFYKTVVWVLRWPLRLLLRAKVVGLENIPKDGGFILCSNHTSNWDPVLLVICTPRIIRFMAKKEIFQVFVLRRLARWLGAFAVDRGSGDFSTLDMAAQYVKEGYALGIFPEGTRSKTGSLGRIKSGIGVIAAKTQGDVLPVSVKAANGKKPALFRRTVVTFGQVIPFESLGIQSDSPRAMRGAIRMITRQMKELCGETEGK